MTSMNSLHTLSSSNPNSLTRKFTKGFLKTLMKIHNNQSKSCTINSTSPREIWRRSRKVKIAADASMASAVGSKRIWSQAILWKIRKRGRRGVFYRRIRRVVAMKKKKKGIVKKEKGQFGNLEQENRLRKLVPGGVVMDTYSLLDETAHYIKCLNTQVKVMRKIAQIY